jgi:hypothetical protein
MAIKTDYNFKGINVPDATIRIIRVFGSSREGWSSLVGVYNTTIETIEAKEAKEGTEFEPAIEASTKEVLNLLEEFNFNVPFSEDKRGYKALYEGLMVKFGGIRVESK